MPRPEGMVDSLALLRDAVGLSSHILRRDPYQLATQLIGRIDLSTDSDTVGLTTGVLKQGRPWLRPVRASLAAPGGELVRTLVGHLDGVSSVAVSPQGSYAASGSHDATVRIWDLDRGIELAVLSGNGGDVGAVCFSPDGSRIMSGSADGVVRIWDWRLNNLIASVEGHTDMVSSVACTPDGRHLVSGSKDSTVGLWDLKRFTAVAVLRGHTGRVEDVAVTPDGRRVISASADNTLRVWDLESKVELAVFDGTWPQYAVTVAPDGLRVVSGTELVPMIWDLKASRRSVVRTLRPDTNAGTLHDGDVLCVAVTPDASRAVSGDGGGVLRLWDLDGDSLHELRRTWTGHRGGVEDVAVTPDARWAVSASSDTTLKLWNLLAPEATGRNRKSTPGAPVKWIGFGPGGAEIIATVRYLDTDDGAEWKSELRIGDTTFRYDYRIDDIAQTLDGRHMVVAVGNHLRVVDALGRKERPGPWDPFSRIALTPEGRRVLSYSPAKGVLRIWDLDREDAETVLDPDSDSVKSLAVTPDGKWGVVGYEEGRLQVWDLRDPTGFKTLFGHDGPVRHLTPYSDGIVSTGADGTVRGWNFSTGRCDFLFESSCEGFVMAQVSRGGELLAAVSEDGSVAAWELPSGRPVTGLPEGSVRTRGLHQTNLSGKPLITLALTEGRPWAVGCQGGTATLWDLSNGRRLAAFTGDEEFESCAVSPGGSSAVVGTVSGQTHTLKIEGS